MRARQITLGLADEERVVRQAIRCLLERERGLVVVGEVADGLDALQLVARAKPHVLVVGMALPGLDGLEVARRVATEHPSTRVVLLTRFVRDDYLLRALRNGVSAFVTKQASADDLVRAVRTVVRGATYVGAPFSREGAEAWVRRAEQTASDPYDALTGREREVLHLAAEGHSSTGIARRLAISPRTAEAHRGNAMRKLQLHNQIDLLRYALWRGILPPLEPVHGAGS